MKTLYLLGFNRDSMVKTPWNFFMNISQLQQHELSWIQSLHEALRSPFLDKFFLGWNFIDTFGFAIILITVVWQMLGRQKGIRMFYILILAGVVNHALKGLFELPRPCQVEPTVGLLCFRSYGFPSGGAQTAILLAGITFIEYKRTLYRTLAVIFAVFLCFSRIYLGVHYFSDVLGGMITGSILVLIYAKLFPVLEKHWKQALVIFPLSLLFIDGLSALLFFSITIGLEIGLIATKKRIETTKPKFSIRLANTIVIIVGLFALSQGSAFSTPLTLIFGFTMGVWLSFLGQWFVQQALMLGKKM